MGGRPVERPGIDFVRRNVVRQLDPADFSPLIEINDRKPMEIRELDEQPLLSVGMAPDARDAPKHRRRTALRRFECGALPSCGNGLPLMSFRDAIPEVKEPGSYSPKDDQRRFDGGSSDASDASLLNSGKYLASGRVEECCDLGVRDHVTIR
jgi:hypothetical protein